MLDKTLIAAELTLVIAVNGNLLTAGEADEGGVCLPLNLIHMRIPPPASAFIAAVVLFSAARELNNIPDRIVCTVRREA